MREGGGSIGYQQTSRVILDMEECSDRDMQAFHGRRIAFESSGDNDESL